MQRNRTETESVIDERSTRAARESLRRPHGWASLLAALMLASSVATLSACEDRSSMDEAMEEIRDEADDAKDAIEDEVDDHS